MQEDGCGKSWLAGVVAGDRIEVGADHRRMAVHVADARQPFVWAMRSPEH